MDSDKGKAKTGFASMRIGAIDQLNRAGMGQGDLLREHRTDARSARLGGVEGHKEIAGIGQAGTIVNDVDKGFILANLPNQSPRTELLSQYPYDFHFDRFPYFPRPDSARPRLHCAPG